MRSTLTFAISFLITCLAVPVLRSLAFRFNILDLPGGRKIHQAATPLLGGVAIYAGIIGASMVNARDIFAFFPLLMGATLIFILGLVNDLVGLSARTRILWQVLISLAVILMGLRVSFVPNGYLKDISEVLITVVWFVGVTNAFNYLDGLDGLAAGSATINVLCFSVILYMTGQYPLSLLAISLIGSCLAFLPYNFKKKIFLGEAGSTFLGFMLAGIGIVGNWASDNVVKLSIPILILGVPIFDMIFTTIIRIKEGKVKSFIEWLKYSGTDHFHHSLIDLGFRPAGSVIFIYFVTFSLGISAIMVSNDAAIEAFLTLSQAAIIFGIIAMLIVVGKRHRSGWVR